MMLWLNWGLHIFGRKGKTSWRYSSLTMLSSWNLFYTLSKHEFCWLPWWTKEKKSSFLCCYLFSTNSGPFEGNNLRNIVSYPFIRNVRGWILSWPYLKAKGEKKRCFVLTECLGFLTIQYQFTCWWKSSPMFSNWMNVKIYIVRHLVDCWYLCKQLACWDRLAEQ